MFVEIVRLLVVAVACGSGLQLGATGGSDGAALLGAVLGASLGYVAGGVLGRRMAGLLGSIEGRAARKPAHQLVAGGLGALVLSVPSALLGLPAVALLPAAWGWPVLGLLVWVGVWEGFHVGVSKADELVELAGLRRDPSAGLAAPDVSASPDGGRRDARATTGAVVDTSALVDGRILEVARTGFLAGPLLVPRFVLDELQGIADAQDPNRRRRGRRGLDLLMSLREHADVEVVDDEAPGFEDVDARLVAVARQRRVALVTCDRALQQVAELQGVPCRNLQALAAALRPVLVPGEVARISITGEGRDPGQGVGYLEDGTMVVVTDGAGHMGHDVDVRVTSSVRTSVGRLYFASLADPVLADA